LILNIIFTIHKKVENFTHKKNENNTYLYMNLENAKECPRGTG
jgi:hypothetical protein